MVRILPLLSGERSEMINRKKRSINERSSLFRQTSEGKSLIKETTVSNAIERFMIVINMHYRKPF